jgi:starch synthase
MYEPCGLTQMRAQRYGALPLARRVGGLADTVEDGVTGFLFDEYTAASFLAGAARAVHAYGNPPTWQAMQRAAMARDFGWDRAEARYRVVYQFALDRRAGEARRS